VKILLVEDNRTLADVSSRLLREVYEHDVQATSTGREALKRLEEFTPDLVLLDVHLPDISGCEVARRIREQQRFNDTVLVALTGWGSLLAEEEEGADSFDAQFRKPMDFDLLPTLHRKA